jgi:hypothetical protein
VPVKRFGIFQRLSGSIFRGERGASGGSFGLEGYSYDPTAGNLASKAGGIAG